MLVWSGRGIVGIVIFGISIVIGESVFPRDMGNEYRFVLALSIAGIVNWLLGSIWNKEKFIFNEEEQQYYIQKNNHTLFWIPMQYMGMIMLGGSVYVMGKSSILWAIVLAIGFLLLFFLRFCWNEGVFVREKQYEEEPQRKPLDHIKPKTKKSGGWESRHSK
ncbi:hypothetical protein HX049_10080 [Myroides odoratimimus]|uniref:hypothetical protein n=1 Tax=Myroides odoratimimus TaxID=76832 RepID=UPI002578F84E|nr:hypothetical protein [Myroides odoratimimus]MDM1397524.1 hypothetical protein [Myroides odoratimimus]